MVLGQHRRMWLEAMRQTEQRVYGFGSLKDGYALVGIHLRKQKCCLKKGTTSDDGVKAGGTKTYYAQIEYNQLTDSHQKLKNTRLENINYEFNVEKIIYSDGTKEEN